MKKRLLLCISTIVALAIGVSYGTIARQSDNSFRRNLEALADEEEPYGSGSCGKKENACMFRCPGCDQLVIASTDDLGPIETYNCSCGYHYRTEQ